VKIVPFRAFFGGQRVASDRAKRPWRLPLVAIWFRHSFGSGFRNTATMETDREPPMNSEMLEATHSFITMDICPSHMLGIDMRAFHGRRDVGHTQQLRGRWSLPPNRHRRAAWN
jgi:hypothetical protein